MCGLCGFMMKKGGCDPEALLRDMTRLLAHRGPDGSGQSVIDAGRFWVGLGHRRLSVIDLSENGAQPMANEDGALSLVYNGEIYNHRALMRGLLERGHVFRSRSDTEAIVHLYEEKGEACVEDLSGMFAFALWDAAKKRLVLARDRVGIKPLFYARVGEGLFFASEIKSLLLAPGVSRDMDLGALDCFFTFGYTPGRRTIFNQIRKLPPARLGIFDGEVFGEKRYWELSFLPKLDLPEEDLALCLREEFTKAVSRHLVSDVPVGAFLSGGLDSGIVTTEACRQMAEPARAFTIGWEGLSGDETDQARTVARACGARHQVFKVTPRVTDILPGLLWHLDEPFFDNSIIPTFLVSGLAREHVKVVLSGDGGDELFGGYEWTRRHQYTEYFSRLPGFARRAAGTLIPAPELEDEYGKSPLSKLKRLHADLANGMIPGFLRRTTVSARFREELYSPKLRKALGEFDAVREKAAPFPEPEVADHRERMLYADFASFLPDDCLFKVDRMSMAHGLEVRVPLLDVDLVELAARIPFSQKIRGLRSKYLLRRAFADFLPESSFARPKQGFTLPVSSWLAGELYEPVKNLLLSERLRRRGLFNRDFIERMLIEHRAGRQELGHRLWSLVIFEAWARLYLDEKITEKPGQGLWELA